MEIYIQQITYINRYLNNEFSEDERQLFDEKLSDNNFKVLYDEHILFLGGLQRIRLKQEIQAAGGRYSTSKRIKYLIVVVSIIGLCILFYSLFFKAAEISTSETANPIEAVRPGVSDQSVVYNIDTSESKNQKMTIQTTLDIDTSHTLKKEIILERNHRRSELLEFYERVKKPSQLFIIDATKDTIINCKEGTILKIEADSFVNSKTNTSIHGKVNLEVVEFYKTSDILLANLTTTSDHRQLETGGMLFVKAYSTKDSLELKNPIAINFPSIESSQAMQLFVGVTGNNRINWKLDINSKRKESTLIDDPLESINFDSVVEIGDTIPNNRFGSLTVYDTIVYYARGPIEEIKEILHDNEAKIDSSFLAYYLDKKKLIREFKINGERYVFMRRKLFEDENSKFKVLPTDSITRGRNIIRKLWDESQISDGQYTRLIPRGRKPIDTLRSRTNSYLFNTTQLGWINCDRFINSNTPRIRFKFKIKEHIADIDAKLIFKNIRSVLPGSRVADGLDFGQVPRGEDVILIAIKVIDNQYYMSIEELKVENLEELNLDFKAYTIEGLKKELERLNSKF